MDDRKKHSNTLINDSRIEKLDLDSLEAVSGGNPSNGNQGGGNQASEIIKGLICDNCHKKTRLEELGTPSKNYLYLRTMS